MINCLLWELVECESSTEDIFICNEIIGGHTFNHTLHTIDHIALIAPCLTQETMRCEELLSIGGHAHLLVEEVIGVGEYDIELGEGEDDFELILQHHGL